MPWYIKYAPPPIVKKSTETTKSEPKVENKPQTKHEEKFDDIEKVEGRTAEIEQLVQTLSQKISHLESIASGEVALPPSLTKEVKEVKADLVYFSDQVGPECQGPILLLQKTGTKFHERRFEMNATGDHPNRTDKDNVKHNYNHSLPTLYDKDADFGVFESHTILRYLCDKFFPNSHWYPSDLRIRTRINNYLDWHVATIRTSFFIVALCLIPAFDKTKGDVKRANVQTVSDALYGQDHPLWKNRADNGLLAQLKVINDRWLAASSYLVGDKCTIADLSLYGDIAFVIHLFKVKLSRFPKLEKWFQSMEKDFGELPARKAYVKNMQLFGEAFAEFLPPEPQH